MTYYLLAMTYYLLASRYYHVATTYSVILANENSYFNLNESKYHTSHSFCRNGGSDAAAVGHLPQKQWKNYDFFIGYGISCGHKIISYGHKIISWGDTR
jgi:hypothetical protein